MARLNVWSALATPSTVHVLDRRGGPTRIGCVSSCGETGSGIELDAALAEVSARLKTGEPVAIGFEASIWTPRRKELSRITSRRGGIEITYNRAWSAGAGTGALGAALALMPWTFARIREASGRITATVDLARFQAGDASLLIWETFVSGIGKGRSHRDDALLAIEAFEGALA